MERALDLAQIDTTPTHRQPSIARVVLATLTAVVASLAADAIIVATFTSLFPATKGYAHFRFGDYAKLTVIGVVIAGASWPVVTRITKAPRWLYLRLAVVVTLVLYLPDLYLLVRGQPPTAVAGLMAMHLAIALITYHLVVRLAPVDRRPPRP